MDVIYLYKATGRKSEETLEKTLEKALIEKYPERYISDVSREKAVKMVFLNKYFAPKLLVPTKEEMKLDSLVYPYNLEETKQGLKILEKLLTKT